MPAVVKAFFTSHQLSEVRDIQNQILFDYQRDFSKHAPLTEVPRINMVWNSIPSQLAKENKKFVYGALKKEAAAKLNCLVIFHPVYYHFQISRIYVVIFLHMSLFFCTFIA